MIPLALAAEGDLVRVVTVAGGRNFTARMYAMGIYPGVTLRVVSNYGPVVVEKDGSRLGIGRGMAERILVEILREKGVENE